MKIADTEVTDIFIYKNKYGMHCCGRKTHLRFVTLSWSQFQFSKWRNQSGIGTDVFEMDSR